MIHKNLHGKESVLYLHSQIGSNIGLILKDKNA